MNTSTVDQLVSEYLQRLERAAEALPPDRRTELTAEIAEHIASARSAGAAANEAAVRSLLDRLGNPEEIVAAALDDEARAYYGVAHLPITTPSAIEVKPSATHESWAVAMLTIGSIAPVIGWLVGVFLLWTSRRWHWWEKLIGTVIVPGGPGVALWMSVFVTNTEVCGSSNRVQVHPETFHDTTTSTVCTTTGPPQWLLLAIFAFVLVAPIVVGVYLYKVARGRADAEPPELQPLFGYAPVPAARWGGLEITAVLLIGLGGFLIPLVGPVVGLILAWTSRAWTNQEKTTATVIAVGPIVLAFLGLAALIA